MNYIEIKIETSHQGVELVIGRLLSLGITDTVVEDPDDIKALMADKDSYHWDYVDDSVTENLDKNPVVTVYLDDTEDNRQLANIVSDRLLELMEVNADEVGTEAVVDTLRISVEFKDDSQWKDKWKEFFKPTLCGDKIVIKPTWEPYEPESGQVVVEIDPGMAFGTGTHETTSLCIIALEKVGCKGKKILDVGTGSGILSIVAAKLGAESVMAIDIDEAAVDVAKENVQLNDVGSLVRVECGNLVDGIDIQADLIVANLMADLVIMLSQPAIEHVKNGGYFITSGILIEKEEIVKEAIINAGFRVTEVLRNGMWCAIIACK